MKVKPGCADAALIISTHLTLYKWRKILDANICPHGQLLGSLFIYWRQTSQSGSTQVDFCLLLPCSQTQIEWRYSSKLSLKSSHNWVIAFGRAPWLPDEHPGSAWCRIRRHCGHFLLVQFVWRRSVISRSIRQLENHNEGLTWSINSPIRGPNSESGKWSIIPAEWQTWLICCG